MTIPFVVPLVSIEGAGSSYVGVASSEIIVTIFSREKKTEISHKKFPIKLTIGEPEFGGNFSSGPSFLKNPRGRREWIVS